MLLLVVIPTGRSSGEAFVNKVTVRSHPGCQSRANNQNNMGGKIPKLSALRGFMIFFIGHSEWVLACFQGTTLQHSLEWRMADMHGSAKSPQWATAGYDKDEYAETACPSLPSSSHSNCTHKHWCTDTHGDTDAVWKVVGFKSMNGSVCSSSSSTMMATGRQADITSSFCKVKRLMASSCCLRALRTKWLRLDDLFSPVGTTRALCAAGWKLTCLIWTSR